MLGWHLGSSHHSALLVSGLVAVSLATLIFWYDLINISRVANDANSSGVIHVTVSPGSGLYLGTIGATAAVVLLALVTRKRSEIVPVATEA